MSRPTDTSKCCNAPVEIQSDDSEGTSFYRCTKCQQACDVVNNQATDAPEGEVTYPGIVDQKTLSACLETAEQVIRDPKPDRVERFHRTKAKLIAQVKAHPLSFDKWNTRASLAPAGDFREAFLFYLARGKGSVCYGRSHYAHADVLLAFETAAKAVKPVSTSGDQVEGKAAADEALTVYRSVKAEGLTAGETAPEGEGEATGNARVRALVGGEMVAASVDNERALAFRVVRLQRERDAAQAQQRATLATWEKALDSFNRTTDKYARMKTEIAELVRVKIARLADVGLSSSNWRELESLTTEIEAMGLDRAATTPRPAPDKGEVASRIVNAIWNADRKEWRSIIEAELGVSPVEPQQEDKANA